MGKILLLALLIVSIQSIYKREATRKVIVKKVSESSTFRRCKYSPPCYNPAIKANECPRVFKASSSGLNAIQDDFVDFITYMEDNINRKNNCNEDNAFVSTSVPTCDPLVKPPKENCFNRPVPPAGVISQRFYVADCYYWVNMLFTFNGRYYNVNYNTGIPEDTPMAVPLDPTTPRTENWLRYWKALRHVQIGHGSTACNLTILLKCVPHALDDNFRTVGCQGLGSIQTILPVSFSKKYGGCC